MAHALLFRGHVMAYELSRRPAPSNRWWLVAFFALAPACQEADPPKVTPKPAPATAAGIPAGALGGEIRGKPFAIQSARYTIDRRHGLEKVDVSLSSGSVESPCADRKPKDATSVWLRRRGAEPLKEQEVHVAPGQDAEWEVHYQAREANHWLGNGEASALVVIHEVGPDLKLAGELWACFADATGSCVSGRFRADYCPIQIDKPVRGTEAMERPPLVAGTHPQAAAAADAGDAAGDAKDGAAR